MFLEEHDPPPGLSVATHRATMTDQVASTNAARAVADDRAALVLSETLHRSSNDFQLIVSAVNNVMRQDQGGAAMREELAVLRDRVALMAQINRTLSAPVGPASISAEALERLCAGLAHAFDRSDFEIEVGVAGTVGAADTRRTALLFIAELMTNALKHGHPGQALHVRLRINATGDELSLGFTSNTPADRIVVRPRMASELAASAGGVLIVASTSEFFDVDVRMPLRGDDWTAETELHVPEPPRWTSGAHAASQYMQIIDPG